MAHGKKGKGNAAEKTNGTGGQGPTPEERRKFKEEKRVRAEQNRQRRMERAEQDDARVVTARTLETRDITSLLGSYDYALNTVRQQLGRTNGVPVLVGVELLERGERLVQEMNRLTADLFRVLGKKYTPPRGMDSFSEAEAQSEPAAQEGSAEDPAEAQNEAQTEISPEKPLKATKATPAESAAA